MGALRDQRKTETLVRKREPGPLTRQRIIGTKTAFRWFGKRPDGEEKKERKRKKGKKERKEKTVLARSTERDLKVWGEPE